MCCILSDTSPTQLVQPLPDLGVVKALQVMTWAAGCGNLALMANPTSLHQSFIKVSTVRITLYFQYSHTVNMRAINVLVTTSML